MIRLGRRAEATRLAAVQVALTLLGLLANPGASRAQEAPASTAASSGGLEEIVVTARKREEPLSKVPVAAYVVGADELDRYSIRDLTSLGAEVPGLSMDKTEGSGNGSITIRGIGSSSLDSGIEQAVSTVMDGVQTSRGTLIQTGLLDVSQVEVLKGPQALFFGKNSPGGVVALHSNDPTDTLVASVRSDYEFDAREGSMEGIVSGPITDTLRARLAVRGDLMRGWIENSAQAQPNPFAAIPGNPAIVPGAGYDYNGSGEFTGRLTVDYKPLDNLTITLKSFGDEQQDRGMNSDDSEITHCANPPHASTLGVVDPSSDCSINNRQSWGSILPQIAASDPALMHNGVPFGDFYTYLNSLTIDYSSGPINVTAVSGYLVEHDLRTQVQPTVFAYPQGAFDEAFHQFSQELRASSTYDFPINFSAGLYYENTGIHNVTGLALAPQLPDPTTGSYLTYITQSKNSSASYSGFGQLRWKIVPTLELDGGARYTYDTVHADGWNSFASANSIVPLAAQDLHFIGDTHYYNLSPETTLSWTGLGNSLAYASYRTGYKAGSATTLSLLPVTFTADNLFYKPEHIAGYEVGFKTQQFNDTLRLNVALFNYLYKDLQVSNLDTVKFEIQSLNVGGLRTKGAEFSADYRPIQPLTLRAAVSYDHSRYTSFDGIACYGGQTVALGCDPVTETQSLTGQEKFRAPEWTGDVGATYDVPISTNYKLELDASMRFSSWYYTAENNSIFGIQNGYQVYDAAVRLVPEQSHWSAALIGRNITNRHYAIASIDQSDGVPGTVYSTVNRPREIIVEAMWNY
jgi:iron complex outermembrane recepter protein